MTGMPMEKIVFFACQKVDMPEAEKRRGCAFSLTDHRSAKTNLYGQQTTSQLGRKCFVFSFFEQFEYLLFRDILKKLPQLDATFSHRATYHAANANPLKVDSSAEVLSGVDGLVTKLLLDTEDLVELGKTLGTSRGTSLDLTSAETDDNVGNGDILGLTRSVGDHDTPASAESVLGGLDGLGDGTDLVDLEEKGVASLGLNGLLDEGRVGDSQIVTGEQVLAMATRRERTAQCTYPTIWKSEFLKK